MFRRQSAGALRLVAAVTAALALGLAVSPAVAQGPLEKIDAAVKWVPADMAFYSSMLRCGEQIEVIGKSRAWAEVKAMPSVQQGLAALKDQVEKGEYAAQLQAAMKNPETRKGIELLSDMFANEAVVFGDDGWADAIDLFQRVQNANTAAGVLMGIRGPAHADPRTQAGLLLSTLADNINLLRVPNLVIAFKLTNRDRAVEELAKLEGLVNIVMMAAPQIGDRFKRDKVGQYEYLTLTLDGSMVPWDAVPMERFKEHELHEGDTDKVFDRLKKLSIVISLGVRDNYLIFSIGPSTDLLGRLGKGASLVTLPEFQRLAPYADRRLTSIGYISKPMALRVMDNTRGIRGLLDTVAKVLPMTELSDDQQKEINKNIADVKADLQRISSEPGAAIGFSFLVDRGVEGYSYSWGDHSKMVATKPLTLLEHVGGNPLLAAVARGKADIAAYEVMVKWASIAKHYVDEYAVPKMPPDARKKYDEAVELFLPLLGRLDEVNRTKLFPSMADGQFGFVLDAKLKSKRFCAAMPEAKEPMPMVEPALVVGVSDADALRAAMAEYRKILNEGIAAARKLNPEIPPFEIPEPKVAATEAGTVYYYEPPKQWGLTKEIALCLGLSPKVGVLTATRPHAERLLRPAPLAPIGLLSDAGRPMALAVLLDWPALVDAATPWVDMATGEILKNEMASPPRIKVRGKKMPAKTAAAAEGPKVVTGDANDAKKAEIIAQVHTVLRILKCFRGVTAESTIEDGVLVGHSLAEFRDIE